MAHILVLDALTFQVAWNPWSSDSSSGSNPHQFNSDHRLWWHPAPILPFFMPGGELQAHGDSSERDHFSSGVVYPYMDACSESYRHGTRVPYPSEQLRFSQRS